MKKVLAIVITLVMLAAMVPISAYALTMPDELTAAGAMEIGTWPLPAGAYDPNLDSAGIPDGAYVYGLYEFDMTTFTGTNFDFPAAITGFTKVGGIGDLTAGTYAEAEIGGYNYVILLDGEGSAPAATTDDETAAPASGTAVPVPAEIANAGAMELGVWPLASGMYDPALDNEGIVAGAYMYGFFDAGYANIELPASIDGYSAVGTAAELTEGTYAGLVVGGFNYVAIMPIGGAFEALAAPAPVDTPADEPAAPVDEEPVAAAPAGEVYITVSVDGKLEVVCEPIVPDKMTVEGAIMKIHDMYYPGGAAAGFAAGIDATWNMYLINTCWGIVATPYVAMNDGMLQATADTAGIKAGDNILITCGSSVPVILTAEETEEGLVVTAKMWILDMSTFSYSSSPFADGKIIDTSGNELGATDADGKFIVTETPDDGIIVLDGLSAINVKTSITAPVVIDTSLRRTFVTVSIDKTLTIAAETIQISEADLTLENVIMKAHELHCLNGGLSGYGDGLMWGISGANYLILVNDKIVTDLSMKLKQNDNILISMSTNPQQPAIAVYIEAFINGSYVTGKAVVVNADGTKTPLVGVAIVGSDGNGLTHPEAAWGADGEVTDANGEFYVSNPSNGIIAMDGLTAFNSIYGADYPVFKGDVRLMRFFIPAMVVNIPLLIIIIYNWKKWHLKDK